MAFTLTEIALMTAWAGLSIMLLIHRCYVHHVQKAEREFMNDFPERPTDPVLLPWTPEKIQQLQTECVKHGFAELTTSNPPRVEIQYIAFKKIYPKPDPFRIQIVRCTTYCAFTGSRDERSVFILETTNGHWSSDNISGDNTFFIIARVPDWVMFEEARATSTQQESLVTRADELSETSEQAGEVEKKGN